MSYATCNKNHPPLMSDGRNFTQFVSGATLSERIKHSQGIKTNADYRKYLTQNADIIIETNQRNACNECCNCPPIYSSTTANLNSPHVFSSCTDSSRPSGYQDSDLKSAYLSSHQLNSRLSTPVITQDELIKNGFSNFN